MLFEFYDRLINLPSKLKSNSKTPAQLSRSLRQSLKCSGTISFRTVRSKAVEENQVLVSGVFDGEDDVLGDPCIEIWLNYNPSQTHLSIDKIDWSRLSLDIAECIGHEFVHREQYYRKRKPRRKFKEYSTDPDTRSEQEYLSDPDEIEAFGFSIAAELAVLHDYDISWAEQVGMYIVYKELFDADQCVMLELHKHIIKYLTTLQGVNNEQTNRRLG